MSPEQAMGERTLDATSDEYSLAAVVYEMLVGEPPHSGPTLQAIIAKLLTQRPISIRSLRETVPVSMANAVEKGLAKLPADRFPTVDGFVRAMTAAPVPDIPEKHSRSWTRVGVGCALAAIAILAIYKLVISSRPVAHQSDSNQVATAPPAQLNSSHDDFSAADSERAVALGARQRAVTAGATTTDLARGDAHLDTAEGRLRNGLVVEGIQQLMSAETAWANPKASPRNSRAEIETLVRDYA